MRVVEQLIEVYGRPAAIRVDNGPELTAQAFVERCDRHTIELRYIQPGKPDQDAYIERFNRNYVSDQATFQLPPSALSGE